MKKINFLLLFVGVLVINNNVVLAQSKIKDGTVTGTDNLPKPDALVEFESSNKGVLLPRVALTDITKALPLINHVNGMLVYNTATAGTAPNNVTPGFYYNNGTKWIQVADVTMQDLRLVGSSNHITQDAGTGGTGTSVGTGNNNIAIGKSSLNANTSGSSNTATGSASLSQNTSGAGNTAVGFSTLKANTTGASNTAMGTNSLYSNTTGHNNTALGSVAGFSNTTGRHNTAIGTNALSGNSTGDNNTAIGANTGGGITTGTNNTILGANVTGLDAALSNNIILADGAGNQRIRVLDNGNTGIGTTTPQKSLHVNGSLQLTNELNVGGDATTAGSAGSAGNLLVSNGAASAPSWKNTATIPGMVTQMYYVQGTTEATINSTKTANVPGLTLTHTVPAGQTQTLMFTISGYASSTTDVNDAATQGVFALMQTVNNATTKISSAYTASVDGGSLINIPTGTTLLKAVTLPAGTYTFTVQYSAWSGNQKVNFVPSIYNGYNGDTEAMLTKMQVLVYNN